MLESSHISSPRQFFREERLLKANTAELFGPPLNGRGGRILVTLSSDAATDDGAVLALAKAGADAVRINCAHDDPSSWAAMIKHVRSAGCSVGRRLKILMDIAGPKCRTADVLTPPGRKHLIPGDRLLLSRSGLRPLAASPFQATLSLPQVINRLTAGALVSVDDGRFGHRQYGATLRARALRGTLGRGRPAWALADQPREGGGALRTLRASPSRQAALPDRGRRSPALTTLHAVSSCLIANRVKAACSQFRRYRLPSIGGPRPPLSVPRSSP